MNEPALVIMAAGMGSRYGGLKQIDPMDDYGDIIMDFSIYDALRAGFKEVVFIIKKAIEEDFKAVIGRRIESKVKATYVYQEMDMLPNGIEAPKGRTRPWGTTHAVLCCKEVVRGPFLAINADDYYGPRAFDLAYGFLRENRGENEHALVGYDIANTLTDNGHVTRGVCVVNEDGFLTRIDERMRIKKMGRSGAYTEDGGKTYAIIPEGTTVSMNFWVFNRGMMRELERGFEGRLAQGIAENPMKYEDLLPVAVQRALEAGSATVKALHTQDSWFGVTYPEDKPAVMASIKELKRRGVYPERLWQADK